MEAFLSYSRFLSLGFFVYIFLGISVASSAQVSLGTPRYSSVSGGPDEINLSNLNMQLSIPIVQRSGRGINFSYGMTYNSAFYDLIVANGNNPAHWQPQSSSLGWGAGGSSTPTAYVAPTTYGPTGCPGQQGGSQIGVEQYSNFVFVDRRGASHPFVATIVDVTEATPCPGNATYPAGFPSGYTGFTNVPSADHSGILLTSIFTGAEPNPTVTLQVTMPDGSTASFPFNFQNGVPYNPGYVGDNNGNFITPTGNPTVSLIPGNSGTGPSFYQWSVQGGGYTDTLGNNPALSVSAETLGPDGAVSIFGTVTYTYGSGSTGSATPHYTNYTIATNFGCTGVAEYVPTTGVLLLDSLLMADGRRYSFTYEPGAGTTTTGRIASITLPSGGKISYAYTKLNNASINCTTGAPVGFTRTVTDGLNTYSSTYAWAQAGPPLTNTTTVTDSTTGAYVVHSFAPIIGGLGPSSYGQELVETSAVSKTSAGTVLKTVSLNYNGGPVSSTNPTYPVTSIQTSTSLPSSTGVTAGTNQVFNSLGMPTETDVYDFGAPGSGTYANVPLSKTVTTYASLGQEYGHPASVTTYGPGGTTVTGETTYGYDETPVIATSGLTQHNTGYNHGNITTVKKLVTGTNTWLTSTYTYNDTGTLATSTDVNGATTTATVSDCNGAFPSSSSSPVTAGGVGTVTLTSSQTWNCAESTLATSTDLNGNTSSAVYLDPYDRPTKTIDGFNNQTTYTYPVSGYNESSSTLVFNSGSSTSSSFTNYDGLNRPVLQQQAQGVGSSNYDSVAVSYNSIGLTSYSSMPYTATLGNRTVTGPGTTSTYDGIGRPSQVTDGGGGYTQYAYSENDTTITTGPAPTGETVKVRVLESDGSGALKSVCEVNSLGGSGSCGQYVQNSGYLTKYTLAAGVTTVLQNTQPNAVGGIQTRTVNVDLLGRTTSESIPELGSNGKPGTITYRYDSDSSGTCIGTYSGDLVYMSDAAGNVTCYTYDNQHRMLSSNVVSGPQSNVTSQSRFVYDVGNFGGTPLKNALGTAVEAYTCAFGTSCTTKLTDLYANTYPEGSPGAYTGRTISQVWQWSTNSGGYYTSQSTNYPNGARANFSASKLTTTGYSTGTVTISGAERNTGTPDVGLVQLTVSGGGTVQTVYNGGSTVYSVAAGLASAVNSAPASFPVTATASGQSVILTSKTTGAGTNYSLSVSSFTTMPQNYTGTSFPASAPPAMSFPVVPALPSLTYALDGEGRVNTVTDTTNSLNLVTGVTYSAWSAPTAITYGNTDSDSYTPDPNTGRVASFKNAVTGTSAFNDTGTLGWNANGSLHTFGWTDGNNSALTQNCTYASDPLSRIASVGCTSTSSPWGQTFSYDALGNVTKVGNGGTSYMAHYNQQTNQVSSGVTATYDANGNQRMSNLAASMTYDANHNPVTAGSTNMLYDAEGRLVEAGGKAVVYGPAGERLGVFNGTTYTATFALPGGGEAFYTSGNLTSLRRKDWLGSSRVSTSWTHAVVSKVAYAPYGETYGTAGTADLDFTGQTQDSVPYLFDFPARKYDPNAGRWTIPDPGAWSVVDVTNPQSFNRYAYILNSPMNMIDPSGLDEACAPNDGEICNLGYASAMQSLYLAQQASGIPPALAMGYTNMQSFSSEFASLPSSAEAWNSFAEVLTLNQGSGLYMDADNLALQIQQVLVDPNNGRLTCAGTAYVMAGNPANVGHEGFPGVTVKNGSAAVIPSQFTGAPTGGPMMRLIGATAYGTVTSANGKITESFNGLTQAIGYSKLGTAQQMQAIAMARNPGALVLEIVGGKDLGPNASVTINIPATQFGCPTGTHQ